ncbi:MAG: hypothetical protein HQK89_07685 [Nitrospirae bacterium]|nr:hypothetical protein [Nitrospirota bacterium]
MFKGTRIIVFVIAALSAFLTFAAVLYAYPNDNSPLGINIRAIQYWGTELQTVDFFKRAAYGNAAGGLWVTRNDTTWDTQEESFLDLDANGWPKTLPAPNSTLKYRYVTTIIAPGTTHYPGGRYTVLYDGQGTLAYTGDAVKNPWLSQAGQDIIDVTPGRGFMISIMSTDLNHTGNYIRNIHIIPPGGTCNNDPTYYAADSSACPSGYQPLTSTYQTQYFHPLFLNDIKYFSTIRFVHLIGTITTQITDWSQRPRMSYASWGYSPPDGAPVELAIYMANTLNASPWLEVPARATDDYITQFAQLTKSLYTGKRPIYLEYYNEAWNPSFPYNVNGNWIQAQGVARWPNSTVDAYTKLLNWYGMRAADVCRIWKQVFAGSTTQIKCVMGSQSTTNTWVSNQVLSCPLYAAEAGVGHNCATQMDALATAPYFGAYINSARYPEINTWLTQADGGLGSLFTELTTGLIARNNGKPYAAIQQVLDEIVAQSGIAKQYGLQFVAYEGGLNLVVPGTTGYDALQNLFATASRDPRMGPLYTQLLNGWKQYGGGLFNIFESTAAYDAANGNSALLEFQGQPRAQAPKYDAMLNFIAANNCWWTGCSSDSSPASNPKPAIKANGKDAASVDLTRFDSLSLAVSLASGNMSGQKADWWLYANTPYGNFYFDLSTTWAPGYRVTYTGELFNLPSTTVLTLPLAGLQSGSYVFTFEVDTNPDGVKNGDIYTSSVSVNLK